MEAFKNRVAVLTFGTEQQALMAVNADETIPVYDTILSIHKYTGQKHVMGMIKANRRILKNEGKATGHTYRGLSFLLVLVGLVVSCGANLDSLR